MAARMPDGNVVLTPSSLDYRTMTLSTTSWCATSKAPLSKEPGIHVGEDAALQRSSPARCRRRCTAMGTHDVCPDSPADPHRRSWCIPRRRQVAEYKTTGSLDLAHEVSKHLSDRAAVLMANHGLFVVARTRSTRSSSRQLVELTAEIVGSVTTRRDRPLPDDRRAVPSYYQMGRGRS
jgi:L-fuculose-phosphate aldolase